ncbi:hypothetical protein D3C86_1692130 [compost metagenome]
MGEDGGESKTQYRESEGDQDHPTASRMRRERTHDGLARAARRVGTRSRLSCAHNPEVKRHTKKKIKSREDEIDLPPIEVDG